MNLTQAESFQMKKQLSILIVDDNELSARHSASYFNAKQTLRYAQMQRMGEKRLKWLSSCFPI